MTRPSLEFSAARLLLAVALGAMVTAPAAAGSADDDLQAVKKAMLASSASQVRPPAEDPAGAVAETKPAPRAKGEPMWLRVRVLEKAGKRARVSINLPIGLARNLGDDWPIPSYHGCRKRDRCGATLGEILRALDTGQNLVEIEDDEATVRVWVE
jgi:hypothetical protein